jgi:hypothetical protein
VNINHIINNASPGPWKWERDSSGEFSELQMAETEYPVLSQSVYGIHVTSKNAEYIAEMNPLHAALMEAEIQAARAYDDAAQYGEDSPAHANAYYDAMAALDTYRSERGLDG